MSRFNGYAKRISEIAQECFKEYQEAEKNCILAQKELQKYPDGVSGNPDYMARAARAKANYLEAENRLAEAKQTLSEKNRSVERVREAFMDKVNIVYGADPSQLDMNTLELLKSGILNYSDFERLIRSATDEENYTMVKIIGKYAGEAAAELEKTNPTEVNTVRALRTLSLKAQNISGKAHIEAFDLLADTFKRCTNNPAMINEWDNLTSKAIETF